MKNLFSAAVFAFGLGAGPALADVVLATNRAIISNFLCVGIDCSDPESYNAVDDKLRLKSVNTRIHFDDTSTGGNPSTDWRIVANDSFAGGDNYLGFTDDTHDTMPFRVVAAALDNSLYVDRSNSVGIGTALPQSNLHIVSATQTASLRLEETFLLGQFHDLRSNSELGLHVFDSRNGATPLYILPGAPTSSVVTAGNGDIGLGTAFPEGKLHTFGNGVQLAYFESADGNAVQVRFRTDSQNRRFLAVNNANEVKSQIVFGDDQITFLGETVAQEWLRISNAGIVSSGPTCNPNPCDATFDPEAFTVPPIEERAAYMWENMHLPAVGPTAPGEPFNLTEKTAGMLHELEIAHIYIEQLHERLGAEAARNDLLQERVSALEARLSMTE